MHKEISVFVVVKAVFTVGIFAAVVAGTLEALGVL